MNFSEILADGRSHLCKVAGQLFEKFAVIYLPESKNFPVDLFPKDTGEKLHIIFVTVNCHI